MYGFHIDEFDTKYGINFKQHITEKNFTKNSIEVDKLNQLLQKMDEDDQGIQQTLTHYNNINSIQFIDRTSSNICWICDGWVEHKFSWNQASGDI